MKFTIYEMQTGRVLYGGHCADPGLLVQVGQALLEGTAHSCGWIDAAGAHHAVSAKPSPAHAFDWGSKEWRDTRTLPQLQDAQWARVREARNAQETVFTYMGREIDAGLKAVSRINLMARTAEHASSNQRKFAIAWTCADDSVLNLDAQQMVNMVVALGEHLGAVHAKGAALRDQIYAQTDAAEVAKIKWNADV